MATPLEGKKVAVLVADGFEQVELTSPIEALQQAGAQVDILSLHSGKVRGWQKTDWGDEFPVARPVAEASPEDYDALTLPGGVINPDKLRQDEMAVDFVNHFMRTGKPIASICHGPQVLIETNSLKGRKLTSYPSVKTDLENAGAEWIDSEVVVDKGLVTSRSPSDLEAFNAKMIEEFCEGTHQNRRSV
jgi:protease I